MGGNCGVEGIGGQSIRVCYVVCVVGKRGLRWGGSTVVYRGGFYGALSYCMQNIEASCKTGCYFLVTAVSAIARTFSIVFWRLHTYTPVLQLLSSQSDLTRLDCMCTYAEYAAHGSALIMGEEHPSLGIWRSNLSIDCAVVIPYTVRAVLYSKPPSTKRESGICITLATEDDSTNYYCLLNQETQYSTRNMLHPRPPSPLDHVSGTLPE